MKFVKNNKELGDSNAENCNGERITGRCGSRLGVKAIEVFSALLCGSASLRENNLPVLPIELRSAFPHIQLRHA